ncbi:MAG: RidA family protein [Planctomycetaceae bacterium]|nr:RidA family protein [Planctomycetaceae bacterium]
MPSAANRRQFLHDGLLITVGACAGAVVPVLMREQLMGRAVAVETPTRPDFEKRLQESGVELPPQAKPVAVYVPAVITGNLLFTAGHIPRTLSGELITGRVGDEMTVEQGTEAARLVALQILSTVRQSLGTLDRVSRLVKVVGMVNCTPGFTQQPQVINGFSELMIHIFGAEAGTAARSAVGVGSLPLNVPVEIEAVFEILPAEV